LKKLSGDGRKVCLPNVFCIGSSRTFLYRLKKNTEPFHAAGSSPAFTRGRRPGWFFLRAAARFVVHFQ
jgi:hypothetical protein